ncbi:hypothetical protein TWF481_009949 [Arthrobotrys musiformis]|uniref:Uncharacterized protein n=1 Tax=Arthrobotrys musiformis TaxID=47236 RepID=A0AAV9VZJ7_9PEZI
MSASSTSRLLGGGEEVPPLRGDGKGVYRIHVIGNSALNIRAEGTQSTLSRNLSKILNIPYVPLDEVFWRPSWSAPSNDEFQSRIDILLDRYESTGWVIDGNYSRRMGSRVADSRTDCIWLDPPLLLYLPRLIFRTFLRLVGLEPNCAPGCQERWSAVFSLNDKSIIWWCIAHHGYCREYGEKMLAKYGSVDDGGKVRRITGLGGELNKWIGDVEKIKFNN